MADEGVCAERMRGGEETRESERGAEINHLTSGWSVHLCLRDRLQIGCDIQEHLGGHGSACFSLLNPLTQTHRHSLGRKQRVMESTTYTFRGEFLL